MNEKDDITTKIAKWIWRKRWWISLLLICIPFIIINIPHFVFYLIYNLNKSFYVTHFHSLFLKWDKIIDLLIPVFARIIAFGITFLMVTIVVESVKRIVERVSKSE